MTDQEFNELDEFVQQLKSETKFGTETTSQVISDVNRYGLEPTEGFYNWSNQLHKLACLEFIYYGRN